MTADAGTARAVGGPTLRPADGESTGITSPSGESIAATDARTAVEAIDWDARLRDAVAKTLAKRDRRRNERADFKRRRDYGLKQRYAAKEARNKGPAGTSLERTDMTTTQHTDEPTDIVGSKGWCFTCQHTVVYDGGPDGYIWAHTNPGVPDDHELIEVTISTDRVRMFWHGKAYAGTKS